MSGLVMRIVDCFKDGKLVVSYEMPHGVSIGRTVPKSDAELIADAKVNLSDEEYVLPPFDYTGWTFKVRAG